MAIPQWHFDGNVSWYGPGFYGKRTACGYAMTESLIGVANRTLPCGTRVTFRNPATGRVVTARVVDRGPYVTGRQWDLTGGLCLALGHCYTGSIEWKLP
ncbi:MAG TPA: septal ring lytic transglycosylase RlpA family protein [Candidatus Limnocylindrales bacterium]|nr:septal ring lytic transglycosylase RlpA family protein [Candidatus Limnocylindrales bacterium]